MSAGRGDFDTIPLASIYVGERLRPTDAARVAALAESISDTGLHAAIVVRPITGRKEKYQLVVGAHRFEAVQSLGHDEIKAVIRDYDAHAARLAEIEENLIRAELIPLDRMVFLAERQRLYQKLYPAAKRGGDRRSIKVRSAQSDRVAGFSKATAKRIGLSERTIYEDISVAARLGHDGVIPKLRQSESGRALTRQQLKALSGLSTADHLRVAEKFAAGDKQALAKALKRGAPQLDPQEEIFRKIVGLLGRASEKTKRRVRDHLDQGARRGKA